MRIPTAVLSQDQVDQWTLPLINDAHEHAQQRGLGVQPLSCHTGFLGARQLVTLRPNGSAIRANQGLSRQGAEPLEDPGVFLRATRTSPYRRYGNRTSACMVFSAFF